MLDNFSRFWILEEEIRAIPIEFDFLFFCLSYECLACLFAFREKVEEVARGFSAVAERAHWVQSSFVLEQVLIQWGVTTVKFVDKGA